MNNGGGKINPMTVAILVGVFILLSNPKRDSSPPAPSTGSITKTVAETLPNIRAAYKRAFEDAAKKIEDGSIANQEQWVAFIKENAGVKHREALDRVYDAIDAMDLPAEFKGREKEVADLNRQIGRAW
jgi:hypothetical protein